MGKYVVALFCDLCKHSQAWNRIPRDQMAGLIGEYKALAEKLGSQYASFHFNFTGDGHLFLFENADAAVRFGLKLVRAWHDEFAASAALRDLPPIPLRVGAHFGESTEIGNGDAWVGRANNVANRIEDAAAPDTVLVSEGMLDLIDIPLYEVQPLGSRRLRGDCVARRALYHVRDFDDAASAAKRPDELTPEDWFLKGAGMIGTAKENTDEHEACYVEALRLRHDYAEVHNNYANLLKERGDVNGAEEHYVEALRLRPDAAIAHYNYANLLKEGGDLNGAEEHYLEALRLDPDSAAGHNNYAVLLHGRRDLKRGDVKSAKEHYVEALRLRPDSVEVHNNYAVLLDETGEFEGAEEQYLHALRLHPHDAEVHNNYANLLLHRGDIEAAEEYYLEALRLCPEYAKAHYNYANLVKETGDVKGAEQHYRRAYELDPSEPDIKSAFERRAWEP